MKLPEQFARSCESYSFPEMLYLSSFAKVWTSKYGSIHRQLRALTVLDGLIENAGPRFQRAFADEALLERLRVAATESLSDPEVKQKCSVLFRQWAVAYDSAPGMERIAGLYKQLPQRKKPARREASKALQETERAATEDPFGNDEPEIPTSPVRRFIPPSFTSTSSGLISSSTYSTPTPLKNGKRVKSKPFNLEKEKPQLLQAIASSSVASTNLMNALKLINREHKRVSEDAETIKRFEMCKLLRRQILRYIHHVESEQWLGSLIHANEELVTALMAYEILDKSVDDDSDSEAESEDGQPLGSEIETKGLRDTHEAFDQLHLETTNAGKVRVPPVPINGKSKAGFPNHDAEEEEEEEMEDENDPFADRNEVSTPKAERPGMTW